MTAEQETHQGVTMKVYNLLINFIFSGLVERRFGHPPKEKEKTLCGQSLCQKMLKR